MGARERVWCIPETRCRIVRETAKAKGPASAPTLPSHGPNIPQKENAVNDSTNTTTPIEGASVEVTRFQMASLREEIESTLEAIAGATLLFRALAFDNVTPSTVNVEVSAFNVKVMHTAIDRAWGAAADTLERMADIEEAAR